MGGNGSSDETLRKLGVTKEPDDPRSYEEVLATIVEGHPIELEDPISTLDKPLIIESANPGWQPRAWPEPDAYGTELPPNYERGGTRYPAVPCSVEEQVDSVVRATEEGCALSHVHPRDPEDCLGCNDDELLKTIYDGVFESVDVIPVQHSWQFTPDGGIDYTSMAEDKLAMGGGQNTYLEGAVVLWPPTDSYPNDYTSAVQSGIEFYEENDIKPFHKIRSNYHARKIYRDLVDPGVMTEEPFVLIHDMGHPFGWPMDQDPWMPMEMIASLKQTSQRFSAHDHLLGVYSGGRNWLPITMFAILIGVDIVRVGIEDAYWMYPHKDEVIQRNIDCVRKITEFCESIGREVAGPDEARALLGME